jgi:hypothetical protein
MASSKDSFFDEYYETYGLSKPVWNGVSETKDAERVTTNSSEDYYGSRNDCDCCDDTLIWEPPTNRTSTADTELNKDFYFNVIDAADELVDLLLSKHEDYGPSNIALAPGGPVNGLAVRLHDKVARLAHLTSTGNDPKHESLRDTFIDIANYGIIGLLVLDGKWDKG